MKNIIMVICVSTCLLLSACASIGPRKTIAQLKPLPDTILEPFHYKIQDPAMRQFLVNATPDIYPLSQRLEIIILREIAKTSSESELPKVFDQLWEKHDQIRKLIYNSQKSKDLIRPMAEIYYLLIANPRLAWRKETAQRLYKHYLNSLEPSDFSGYALHFFTLALLKEKKIDVAMPFLHEIKRYTPPPVYLKDLKIALGYAIAARADQFTSQLMADICHFCMDNRLQIPADTLASALMKLKRRGSLVQAKEALLPIVKNHPSIARYSFAKLLLQSDSESHWTVSKLSFYSQRIQDAPSGIVSARLGYTSLVPTQATPKVQIDVQIIQAGNGPENTDPVPAPIAKSLKETLKFSSFSLLGVKTFQLRLGEKGSVPLPHGNLLHIVLRSLKRQRCRIELSIMNGKREVFHTYLESIDGGVAIIGGPQHGDTTCLIRISTCFTKTRMGQVSLMATEHHDKTHFNNLLTYDTKTKIASNNPFLPNEGNFSLYSFSDVNFR